MLCLIALKVTKPCPVGEQSMFWFIVKTIAGVPVAWWFWRIKGGELTA
jgi:hypothetical protein